MNTGIGNRITPESIRLEKLQARHNFKHDETCIINHDPDKSCERANMEKEMQEATDKIFAPAREMALKTAKAYNKYERLVQNLTLEEFLGLWQVVQREREARVAQQMLENPFFAELVIEDMQKKGRF